MSMRQTEEIAHEASRFSLRSLFPMSSTMRSHVSDPIFATPPPQTHVPVPVALQPQAYAPMPTQAPSRAQLRFNLPLQHTGAGPTQQDPFKFALPLKAQPHPQPISAAPDPMPVQQAAPTAASTPEFRPTALTSISGTASHASHASAVAATASVPSPTAMQPMAGGIPGVAAVRAMPIEAHEAEVARIAVAHNEVVERLKLSDSKLMRTEASVMRGNQALATERVQFKQKIVSLTEEMNTLRANEKRAVEELSLRADESVELAKLKLEMKQLEERCDVAETTASEFTSLSDDYMELSSLKNALQAEVETHTDALATKQKQLDSMALELDAAKRTTATAEANIDVLDAKLAELRVEKIFEPSAPAATGQVFPTGKDLREEVDRYIMKNYKSFKIDEHNHIRPGDRVIERDSGRVGTVQRDEDGEEMLSGAFHPAVRYDDDPSFLSKAYNKNHFRVITDEKSLPPFPWVAPHGIPWASTAAAVGHCGSAHVQEVAEEEGEEEEEEAPTPPPTQPPTFKPSAESVKKTLEQMFGKPEEAEVNEAFEAAVAGALASMNAPAPVAATPASEADKCACMVVRVATHCKYDTADQEHEAKAARDHLAKQLHERYCTMGVNRAEGALAPDLHAYVETGAPSDALRAAQIANPAAATDAAVRTAVYVQAVSEDIKKRMNNQRDIWLQTVQIGAAA